MPPKVKISKEELLNKSFSIAREFGIESVTAREIGKRLGLSSRATYSYFTSVELLKEEIVEKVYACLFNHLVDLDPKLDPFLSICLNYIRFAKNEKELYRIVQTTGKPYIEKHKSSYREMMIKIIKDTPKYAEYDEESLKNIFFKMGIFIHGLADLLYQNEDEHFNENFIIETVVSTARALIENSKLKKSM
jgi:AcrR family transcriptional regulator